MRNTTNNINMDRAAVAAREAARHDNGRFGTQEHSAPELAIDDPKVRIVGELIAQHYATRVPGELGVDELRKLMLDAIDAHQQQNPAVVVIGGERNAYVTDGVEVIDLDYLGEYYDDGASTQEHVERATKDLERMRELGMAESGGAYQLWSYLGDELYREYDLDWYDDTEHAIRGVHGGYALVTPLVGDQVVTVVEIETGEEVSEHSSFEDARTAALAAGEKA